MAPGSTGSTYGTQVMLILKVFSFIPLALAAGAQKEMKDKLILISVFLKTLVLILCHIEVLEIFVFF